MKKKEKLKIYEKNEEKHQPDINAQIIAERLAYSLDKGRDYRRTGNYGVRKVIEAGVHEVDVIILFKNGIQKIRMYAFRASKILKNNQTTVEVLDKGMARCKKNAAILGVIVKMKYDKSKLDTGIMTQEEYRVEEEQGVLCEEDKKLFQL